MHLPDRRKTIPYADLGKRSAHPQIRMQLATLTVVHRR
jgi:hypothetical protein